MTDMRLKFLSIASDLWLIFNGDNFVKFKDRLFMEHGETTNRQDINKQIVCHNFFNMGVFSYKQPNKKDNTTANEMFKKKS